MDIEVLHIDDCPGWASALERVREALASIGSDLEVTAHALHDEAEVADTVFAGSPIILVDGTDLFPSDGQTASLACRVYRTERGLAPAPTTAQIVDALRQRLAA